MPKASGKVIHQETGRGIPDLLIELYHAPSGNVGTAPPVLSGAQRRLGSTLTEADGTFRLEYEAGVDRAPTALVLSVKGPELMGVDAASRLLHVSSEARQGASANETFLVYVPTKKLAAAGLVPPTAVSLPAEEPTTVMRKVSLAVDRQREIAQDLRKVATAQVSAERRRLVELEDQVEARLEEALTGVPLEQAAELNYVPRGASVQAAMVGAMQRNLQALTKQITVGQVLLSQEEAERLEALGEIPAEELEPLLFGAGEDRPRTTVLVREDPLSALARSAPPPLLKVTEGPGEEPDVEGDLPSDEDGSGSTPDGVEEHLRRLLASMTAPEAVLQGTRATPDQVEAGVGSFNLHSGPADVPAFYDFHSLQIAFDYVWQKAIDEGVIEGAKALSRQLDELGGAPSEALSAGDPIRGLRRELRTVSTALTKTSLGSMARVIGEGPPSWVQPLHPDLQVLENPFPPVPTAGGGGGGGGTVPPGSGWGGVGGTILWPSVDLYPHELLNQIEGLLNERYSFEIFAPGSVNFGLLVTYRQKWTPVTYQVGNLVKTLTLTPKETRRVVSRRVIKKERSVKEMEQSLRVRKEDTSDTGRDEKEIVAKAEVKTNFNLNAKGSYSVGLASGSATVDFGRNAATNSSDVKKAFREAVVKAAQEYRDERKLEVEAKDSYEEEVSETWEISNPNDELPVTFLFYELQRRYKIAEHIHRLTPVVLVAMNVPNPGRRSMDALLMSHGWILNRVLLDDQFRPALEYLRHRIVGDEMALRSLLANVNALTKVVDELKRSYSGVRNSVNTAADALQAMIQRRAQRVASNNTEAWWEKAVEAVVGEGDSEDLEAARILEDAAREGYERAVNQEKELRSRLDSESASLSAATEAYAKANAEHHNRLTEVGCLRLHVKENILYYMQAIWSHTFQDQTFLSLHKKRVPRLKPLKKRYVIGGVQPAVQPGQANVRVEAKVDLTIPNGMTLEEYLNQQQDWATLAEVADLDNLLGFKGNYLIFPLKQSNALTDFMMTPYVDAELGLRDPDPVGNWTPEEFVQYARALYAQVQARVEAEELPERELERTLARLTEQYRRLLSMPHRAEEEITVPSGSLYVEALPGAHPILEDFKLLHRAVDVKKAMAEVRKSELESVRYAARVLAGEHGDPDVERQVFFHDGNARVVVPADPS